MQLLRAIVMVFMASATLVSAETKCTSDGKCEKLFTDKFTSLDKCKKDNDAKKGDCDTANDACKEGGDRTEEKCKKAIEKAKPEISTFSVAGMTWPGTWLGWGIDLVVLILIGVAIFFATRGKGETEEESDDE